jgi:hypothetical protein
VGSGEVIFDIQLGRAQKRLERINGLYCLQGLGPFNGPKPIFGDFSRERSDLMEESRATKKGDLDQSVFVSRLPTVYPLIKKRAGHGAASTQRGST